MLQKSFVNSFIRESHGMSSVEYALMLMIIVVVSTLGLNAFTLITDDSFDTMAYSLESGNRPRVRSNSLGDNEVDGADGATANDAE